MDQEDDGADNNKAKKSTNYTASNGSRIIGAVKSGLRGRRGWADCICTCETPSSGSSQHFRCRGDRLRGVYGRRLCPLELLQLKFVIAHASIGIQLFKE